MPNLKSAKKALRQNVSRRARNIVKKEAYKKALKNLQKLMAAKKEGEARNLLPSVYKALDKAAKSQIISPNKSGRLKSQAARLLKV